MEKWHALANALVFLGIYIFLPLMIVISMIRADYEEQMGNSSTVTPEYVSSVVVRMVSFTNHNHKRSFISDLRKGRNLRPEAWGWRDYNRWLPQDSVLNGNWYTGAKNHALSRMKDEQKKKRFSFLFPYSRLWSDRRHCENQFKEKQNIFVNA